MSGHLEILKSMFPAQILLDVDEIARCMRVSPGHIYNLVSAKKFPLKLERGFGNRVTVSLVALANYLDKTLLPDTAVPGYQVIIKKKVGRPRKLQSQIAAFAPSTL